MLTPVWQSSDFGSTSKLLLGADGADFFSSCSWLLSKKLCRVGEQKKLLYQFLGAVLEME
jgi:hypothetical protein